MPSTPAWLTGKTPHFLFQLTNDELPTLAAGQTSLLAPGGDIQPWQVESFVFLTIDLKPGNWSRTRLAALTREVNRLFPMPATPAQSGLTGRYPNPRFCTKSACIPYGISASSN
jgi:hypothetical protein